MVKYILLLFACFLFHKIIKAQPSNSVPVSWQGILTRTDGKAVHFNFEERRHGNKTILVIKNAAEKIQVSNVTHTNDSIFVKMPVFESSFSASYHNNMWTGTWTRGTAGKNLVMPFEAVKSNVRYTLPDGPAAYNLGGRWAVKFFADTGKNATSVAELQQKGNNITGTFITPTGDYRYLQGVVSGSRLTLSGFDGAHAVLFEGELADSKHISSGMFYSGPTYKEAWSAERNSKAIVKIDESAMYVRPGEQRLSFSFPDLDSNIVSIGDKQFKNKVVIVQLMGSWCPNCMDETAFLSDFYTQNRQRGVEVVALAYEYSTDFARSRNSLLKFKQRFHVQYPILITGVTVADSLRTEKTLPQVTPIRVFPSSIILDRKGHIVKLDNGFAGPATGMHYEAYKKDFYETIERLVK